MCPWPLGIILKYHLSEFSRFVLCTNPSGHFAIFMTSNCHAFSLVIIISTFKTRHCLVCVSGLVVDRGETLSLAPQAILSLIFNFLSWMRKFPKPSLLEEGAMSLPLAPMSRDPLGGKILTMTDHRLQCIQNVSAFSLAARKWIGK